MGFEEALALVKQGGKVRRACWEGSDFAHIELCDSLPGWGQFIVVVLDDGRRKPCSLTHERVLANDWEIVL
jgi:MoaA/NifB/PqqE/SkfB family radical SAM enzyme